MKIPEGNRKYFGLHFLVGERQASSIFDPKAGPQDIDFPGSSSGMLVREFQLRYKLRIIGVKGLTAPDQHSKYQRTKHRMSEQAFIFLFVEKTLQLIGCRFNPLFGALAYGFKLLLGFIGRCFCGSSKIFNSFVEDTGHFWGSDLCV